MIPWVQKTLMFGRQAHISGSLLIFGVVCIAGSPGAWAGDSLRNPVKLSGVIGGVVTNAAGSPQMGASVVLYNRQERICDKVVTDERGQFHFAGLFPDLYAIRVSLATFVPALKKDILVQPGMRALLNVNLNSLFSSIQVAYPSTGNATFMTDDWKWVLRSASATRPVLRFTEDPGISTAGNTSHASLFSDTRGLLQLSAGDGPLVTGTGDEADLGTAFALATSVFGSNRLELSGNLGYGAQTGIPVTAFRTAYATANGPEVALTMRQVYLPGRFGVSGVASSGLPALRSMSASVDQNADLTDQVSLQYGFAMDSVEFSSAHLGYFSPYGRLVYSLDPNSSVAFAFSSGNAHPDLADVSTETQGPDGEMQRELGSIGLFPRIATLHDSPTVQRGSEFELSYSRRAGSRRLDLSAYREIVTNAALSLVGPNGMYFGDDLLPDLFTGNAIFNAGNYTTSGYSAAFTQELGPNLNATVVYGTTPGLTAGNRELVSNSPDELRSMIHASHRQSVTARISAVSPWTGTHIIASYQWLADAGWVTLGNQYTTQSIRQLPGFNVYVRQPIPHVLPWRVELTADLRNLLAEGYLPLESPSGESLLLVQTPRSFRGGLNFIF
jgi:hypothetical protein